MLILQLYICDLDGNIEFMSYDDRTGQKKGSTRPMKGEFRFVYNSDKYDETVAFYRDGLGLALLDSWDEGPEARGSVFQAASGIIEVMEHPATQGDQWAVYTPDLPKGVGLAFEVENVDELYQRALAKKLPIKTKLGDFNWGQRGFAIFEPNGLVVFVYATEVGS